MSAIESDGRHVSQANLVNTSSPDRLRNLVDGSSEVGGTQSRALKRSRMERIDPLGASSRIEGIAERRSVDAL